MGACALLAIDFLYIEYGVASPSPPPLVWICSFFKSPTMHFAPITSETNPVHVNVHVQCTHIIVYSFMHSRRYVFSPFSV